METCRIARVDAFDEPRFTQLCGVVFPQASATSERFGALAKEELAGRTRLKDLHSHLMVRIGAFQGDELIAWSVGWFEREGAFYMANSAGIHRGIRLSRPHDLFPARGAAQALPRAFHAIRAVPRCGRRMVTRSIER